MSKNDEIFQRALQRNNDVQTAQRNERLQNLEDRRFCTIPGAQWEGALGDMFRNRPMMEHNKVHSAAVRLYSEYRNNNIGITFISKDGTEYDELADTCAGLFRADEQDSCADEAYDNAYDEAVTGGIGAWRYRNVKEDEYEDEDEKQRIRIEPINDADTSVYFDLNSKRMDKSDADWCFVITSMTLEAFKSKYPDESPTTWQKNTIPNGFDWYMGDSIYVAEYYECEKQTYEKYIYTLVDGSEETYTEFDEIDEEEFSAIGTKLKETKKCKRKRVHKYLLSGGGIIQDFGLIAGSNIPIVINYGKRWFIDGIERAMGCVRLAKDPQRNKNIQVSKLTEMTAAFGVEKPIFYGQQINNHKEIWETDNVNNYQYLTIDPMEDMSGNYIPGPIGYTRAPQIPPAMAALLQITEQDMQDILGNQQQAEKMISNISEESISMIQTSIAATSFIYMSNMAKAKQRGAEIWLGMASEVYVEPNRKMKSIGVSGDVSSTELNKPIMTEDGMDTENDMRDAKFDVVAEVGASSGSKKQAIVKSLMAMMQVTQDPQDLAVLSAMVVMNLEGEGLSNVKAYYRKKLIAMGIEKPNEAEIAELQAQGQNTDPNATYLESAAKEADAKAAEANANTVLKIEQAHKTKAETLKLMADTEAQHIENQLKAKAATSQPIM